MDEMVEIRFPASHEEFMRIVAAEAEVRAEPLCPATWDEFARIMGIDGRV